MKHTIQTGALHVSGIPAQKRYKPLSTDAQMIEAIEYAKEKGRAEGMGYMAAEFLRVYGEHSGIRSAWKSWKMTVQECREKEISEYDLEVLEEYEQYLDN